MKQYDRHGHYAATETDASIDVYEWLNDDHPEALSLDELMQPASWFNMSGRRDRIRNINND